MTSNHFQGLIEEGYAKLLDVPVDAFHQDKIQIFESNVRNSPAWAKWVIPIWILRIDSLPIISVSPSYIEVAKQLKRKIVHNPILSTELYEFVNENFGFPETIWHQREIFVYADQIFLNRDNNIKVIRLAKNSAPSVQLLKKFDGGVFTSQDDRGKIIAYAGIKNKGVIQEIAVWTHEAHRRQGFGQAVVSEAINKILKQKKAPVYIPDNLDNTPSYLLAKKLNFEKVGEMIFLEREISNWNGFLYENALIKFLNWCKEKAGAFPFWKPERQ